MAQRGAYARRNLGHRGAQAARLAAARGDMQRLTAAFDMFRSAVALLSRRRPPRDADQSAHRAAAAGLTRDVTAYLKDLADAIDRGDYDAQ